jgi:hypothetical protein
MEDGDDPGAGGDNSGHGFLAFWGSLPAVLKGLAAVITAAIALLGVWRSLDGGGETLKPSAGAGGGATSAAGEPGGPTGDALAHGRLTLQDKDTANLKAKHVSAGGADADVSLLGAGTPDYGMLYAPYGGLLAMATDLDDKAGCVAALNARSSDRVQLPDLQQGSLLCLKTHAGEIALLHIVSPVAIGSPQLVFEYTLWP